MFIGQKMVRLASIGLFAAATAASTLAQEGGSGSEAPNLLTKDGVQLRASYFPAAVQRASKEGKQATPVILLHDFKGTRAAFAPLIAKLQATGEGEGERPHFAVMAVDLRAHGESVSQIAPDGTPANLDPAKLTKEDYLAMTQLDMEAVRSFLVDKNDAGELNLNKLCIVGSGMGASVAANWALQDWTAPPLFNLKQGQDVKALVLISPRWSYNGLTMQAPMKFNLLKQNVAWLVIYGVQDAKVKADFDRVYKQLERAHPTSDKKTGAKMGRGLQGIPIPSSLQGDQLLSKSGDTIDDAIVSFLTENVAALQLPWTSRRSKLP
jgi:pimeloyl-ACP methyl ester carboxylesterase